MRNIEVKEFDRAFLIENAKSMGFELSKSEADKLEKYYYNLVNYNNKVNLTAITEPHEVAVKHFIDSMLIARADIKKNARLADVGTGAGFPSVPFKIIRNDVDITLIDSLNKRLVFLEELLCELELEGERIHARAEEAGRQKKLRESFDVVTARAVARLYELCELCIPLLKKGGIFISMKSGEVDDELKEAERAVKEMGGKVKEVLRFTLPDDSSRSLVIIEKTSTTPDKYPRQSAKISKNPLI